MASIFTKIIRNELPAYRVYEDDMTIAILALDQVNLGHCLVIPKLDVCNWYEVPEKDYLAVQKVAQKLGRAITEATQCPRVGQMVAGFEVPHFHLHLIPAWSIPDLDFKRAQRRSEIEMKEIQQKILAAMAKL